MPATQQRPRATATLYTSGGHVVRRRVPRRRRLLVGAVLASLSTAAAFATADLPHHGGSTGAPVLTPTRVAPGSRLTSTRVPQADPERGPGAAPLSTGQWPSRGQAAYVLGDSEPVVSPHEQPVPIASLAKVMTAYLVLQHHPLGDGDIGPAFAVGNGEVADTEMRRRDGQSVITVRAGEQLSERDVLMAILLPSANNIAVLVARELGGSVASFVAEMNATARSLGMSHTTYTDPSGYDPGTVSTALDQLRLARVVARDPTLAAIMATRSYRLPVAGVVTNTDTLLGQDGFVGMKTGSDRAAGGCFMFRAVRRTSTGDVTLIGVVLGQHGTDLIGAGLNAARDLADRVTPEAATTTTPGVNP